MQQLQPRAPQDNRRCYTAVDARSHSMVSSETYLAVTLSAALAEALATWTVSVWSSDV